MSMPSRFSDFSRRHRESARVPEMRSSTGRPERRRGRRIPQATEPRAENGNGRPRLKKLRVVLVLLGLAVLALVSWVFGIMMAVAQDLPSLENREQYRNAQNSVIYDRN